MARSLAIAAYLAGLSAPDGKQALADQPPRPSGVIIWARCSNANQLTAIATLGRKLAEDGDPVEVIATVPDWDDSLTGRALPEPKGRKNVKRFMAHWRPVIGIWVQHDLNPVVLEAWQDVDLPSLLVDASADGLEQVVGGWVPGAMRSILSQFGAVLTLDQPAAEALIKAGAPQEIVRVTGPMEDCAPALPCSETERQDFANVVGTRPVWLAASAHFNECADLITAHRTASQRAHRLLLIVVPHNNADAAKFAESMREQNFYVTLRSDQSDPDELTQVYVIDTDEELGLWYRIAPITYLGGTLYGDPCRDPSEPAALGSAMVYGPHVAPYQKHATRLNAAAASHLIRSGADLGPLVETLLSTDKAATLAHAAWDVTSRGADVTNRIVNIVQRRLETLGH